MTEPVFGGWGEDWAAYRAALAAGAFAEPPPERGALAEVLLAHAHRPEALRVWHAVAEHPGVNLDWLRDPHPGRDDSWIGRLELLRGDDPIANVGGSDSAWAALHHGWVGALTALGYDWSAPSWDFVHGKMVLHHASRGEAGLPMVQALLAHGVDPNSHADTVEAMPLLTAAVSALCPAMVQAVLDAGGRVHGADHTGATALHAWWGAVQATQPMGFEYDTAAWAVLEILLDHGASWSALTQDQGCTPLHHLLATPTIVGETRHAVLMGALALAMDGDQVLPWDRVDAEGHTPETLLARQPAVQAWVHARRAAQTQAEALATAVNAASRSLNETRRPRL